MQEENKDSGNNSLIVYKNLKLNKWILGNVPEGSKNKPNESKYKNPVKLQIGAQTNSKNEENTNPNTNYEQGKDAKEIVSNHKYKHKLHKKTNTKNVEEKIKSTSGEIKNETAIEYPTKHMYAEVTKKRTVKRFEK